VTRCSELLASIGRAVCRRSPSLRRRSLEFVAAALLGLMTGCIDSSHCGYDRGDATCVERDPRQPHCDLCTAKNDGCVAVMPVDLECVRASDAPATTTATTATTDTDTTSTTAGIDG
jgi:hypothetical protein